jgi:hypothetical protein
MVATAIPVFTGCPVTMGFITRAMTSTSINAAARYVMSCLSMVIEYILIFPAYILRQNYRIKKEDL